MKWLVYCTLLLTVLEVSLQINCPYADLQRIYQTDPNAIHHEAPPNSIHKHAENHYAAPGVNYGPITPVPDGGLTRNDVDTLLQNYFNSNNGRRGSSSAGSGDTFFDNLYGSYEGAASSCAVPPTACANDTTNYYFRTYDGSCNNLAYPGYGMAKSRYIRLLAPKYGDGKYTPSKSLSGSSLPNSRLLSLSLYGEETLPDTHRTYMSMQFGQFVGHDISRFATEGAPKDCCDNPNQKLCYPISLVPHGPISLTSGKKCLDFARSLSDMDMSCAANGLGYAEKISTSTAYLDMSSIYGNSLEQNIKIRQYHGGLLKTAWYNNNPYLPLQHNINGECRDNNDECYNIPDSRNDLTPPIAILHTIFVREHNRLATILAQLNPQYSDEKLFQIARKINIAQYQKIAYYDWLPMLMGPTFSYTHQLIHQVPPYEYVNDYDESLESAAYAGYSAAAFRYCHTQIPGWFSMVSPARDQNQTLRLSDYTGRSENIKLLQEGNNFDALVRGLVTQLQKRSDSHIDKEVKHHFNRKTFDEFGTDLKAHDIQRGRDYGLPSYNDYRQHCGLPRAYDWSGFAREISSEHIALLQKFYASPNDVDLSVGGSLEAHAPEALFGPTFQCIVGKQFLRTRRSDRFFFEREDQHSGFTREQLAEIRKVSMSGILCANSNNLACVQPNAFVFPNENNDLVNCKAIPQLNLALWKDQSGY